MAARICPPRAGGGVARMGRPEWVLCGGARISRTWCVVRSPCVVRRTGLGGTRSKPMSGKVAAGSRVGKLGRYEVLNELGKGAMGVVYLAKDPVIGRLVAIKTIKTSQTGDDDSESREFRERFVREAQTAGILSHPNIVTIHDIG